MATGVAAAGARAAKRLRITPTHFVAIPVTSTVIRENVAMVHRAMVECEPLLAKLLVDVAKCHVTLLVMRLEADDDFTRAMTALKESATVVSNELGKDVEVGFRGLDTFGGQVVFARPGKGEHELTRIGEIVRECFSSRDIDSVNVKSDHPHLTIAKMSKHVGVRRKLRTIALSHYVQHLDLDFGVQTVNALQLCSMIEKGQRGNYYPVIEEMQLM